MQQLLPITAIVCVRNRAESLGSCIATIRAARPQRILVVDGASTDGTPDVARSLGADVVDDMGAGLGAARQLGAQHSRTEWVAYIDSDAEIMPGTLESLLHEAQRDGYDAVQAELRSRARRPTYWQRGERWRRRMQEQPGLSPVIGCQATLVRRSLLLSVGFDPAFTGAAEDHDWCFRAIDRGARFAHTAASFAYHEDRASFGDFVSQRLWYGRGMTRLLLRHRRLAPQMRSASTGMVNSPRYLPFMMVSWSITAAGMLAEAIYLLLRPGAVRRLRIMNRAQPSAW